MNKADLKSLTKVKVNFHFSMLCNMRCKFCFYKPLIEQAKYKPQLEQWIEIVKKLKVFKGINFAGGEPTLYWNELLSMLKVCKENNIYVSLITNGSGFLKRKDDEILELLKYVEVLGLSVDSINEEVNLQTGRCLGSKVILKEELLKFVDLVHQTKTQLKINTVVHEKNYDLKMIDFIKELKPYKWKVMQVCEVGQKIENDLAISFKKFEHFLKLNELDKEQDFIKSIEDESTVTSSYVMIDGEGVFYNSNGIYSKNSENSIIKDKVDLLTEFNKCDFDIEKQIQRYKSESK